MATYAEKCAGLYSPVPPGNNVKEVRPMGRLRDIIESLNRLGNLISEDITNISIEIDRIAGPMAVDPNKSEPRPPANNDLDVMQEQLDRLDRLAQFTRQQLDRIRSL